MNNKDINMLDKNGNKLLKPSPLKAIGSIINIVSGHKGMKAADEKRALAQAANDAAAGSIKDALGDIQDIDINNPFEDITNAYEGMENQFADAENVYEDQKNVYAGMENKFAGQKNAFEGMENAMEDLTVNTQQAEFEAQQNQQMQANIMSQMSGAAGGSGIAALAQSMANQGALQAQKASASIGAQEADNAKKQAEASQDIAMKTAAEESRLDTQSNQADADIQNKIMDAEGAMQAAELGEQSRLNMAEMTAASDMQMAEAGAEMQMQMAEAQGEQTRQGMEMGRAETMLGQANLEMDRARSDMDKADAEKMAAQAQRDQGIANLFNPLSDERVKENIIKIKYSNSGIPIYHFNYKGDSTTWSGTMAQDLIKLNKDHAITVGDDGYYRVNYNLIDVDMRKITPSPLKQKQPDPKEQAMTLESAMDAGMDILSENQKRKNWEDLQFMYKASEVPSMRRRKSGDKLLRQGLRRTFELEGGDLKLPHPFTIANTKQIKIWHGEMWEALKNNDKVLEKEIMAKLAALDQANQLALKQRRYFYEDHLLEGSDLSKGVSKQQTSFATQIFCDNPNLQITFATEKDIRDGRKDYYGNLVIEGAQYGVVYDFYDNVAMVPIMEANKDMFLTNKIKVLEYVNFIRETNQKAVEGRKAKSAAKINLGAINYKIDQLFGYFDGEASKEQNELVLSFTHDDAILEDGSTFIRHLLEHPNIQNLSYGSLDLSNFDELNLALGEGDSVNWTDMISEIDKFKIVDAMVNVDNPFFDMELLRRLVKEYYTIKVENAWWKGMGFDEGRLGVMRLKQNELIKVRFKKDKAEAMKEGRKEFTFDGEVYPTGMTDAKIKKQEKEKEEAVDNYKPTATGQAQTPPTTTGSNQGSATPGLNQGNQ